MTVETPSIAPRRVASRHGRSPVDALLAAALWLTLDPHEDECRHSDDALDTVIAALTARAATKGLVTAPKYDPSRYQQHRRLDRPADMST